MLNEKAVMGALGWAYDKAVDGLPGFSSAEELARNYLTGEADVRAQVDSLIRWQNAKAATTGFVTGLGGLITLPVTVPANIASVLLIQVRMIAAIAFMGGYDLKDDRVKTFVYMCLAGYAAKDIVSELAVDVSKKLAISAIKKLPGKTVTAINKKVGFRLLTKFGEKGAVNLGKAVPVLGGAIGATFDGFATNFVGNRARDIFCPDAPPESPPSQPPSPPVDGTHGD